MAIVAYYLFNIYVILLSSIGIVASLTTEINRPYASNRLSDSLRPPVAFSNDDVALRQKEESYKKTTTL